MKKLMIAFSTLVISSVTNVNAMQFPKDPNAGAAPAVQQMAINAYDIVLENVKSRMNIQLPRIADDAAKLNAKNIGSYLSAIIVPMLTEELEQNGISLAQLREQKFFQLIDTFMDYYCVVEEFIEDWKRIIAKSDGVRYFYQKMQHLSKLFLKIDIANILAHIDNLFYFCYEKEEIDEIVSTFGNELVPYDKQAQFNKNIEQIFQNAYEGGFYGLRFSRFIEQFNASTAVDFLCLSQCQQILNNQNAENIFQEVERIDNFEVFTRIFDSSLSKPQLDIVHEFAYFLRLLYCIADDNCLPNPVPQIANNIDSVNLIRKILERNSFSMSTQNDLVWIIAQALVGQYKAPVHHKILSIVETIIPESNKLTNECYPLNLSCETLIEFFGNPKETERQTFVLQLLDEAKTGEEFILRLLNGEYADHAKAYEEKVSNVSEIVLKNLMQKMNPQFPVIMNKVRQFDEVYDDLHSTNNLMQIVDQEWETLDLSLDTFGAKTIPILTCKSDIYCYKTLTVHFLQTLDEELKKQNLSSFQLRMAKFPKLAYTFLGCFYKIIEQRKITHQLDRDILSDIAAARYWYKRISMRLSKFCSNVGFGDIYNFAFRWRPLQSVDDIVSAFEYIPDSADKLAQRNKNIQMIFDNVSLPGVKQRVDHRIAGTLGKLLNYFIEKFGVDNAQGLLGNKEFEALLRSASFDPYDNEHIGLLSKIQYITNIDAICRLFDSGAQKISMLRVTDLLDVLHEIAQKKNLPSPISIIANDTDKIDCCAEIVLHNVPFVQYVSKDFLWIIGQMLTKQFNSPMYPKILFIINSIAPNYDYSGYGNNMQIVFVKFFVDYGERVYQLLDASQTGHSFISRIFSLEYLPCSMIFGNQEEKKCYSSKKWIAPSHQLQCCEPEFL